MSPPSNIIFTKSREVTLAALDWDDIHKLAWYSLSVKSFTGVHLAVKEKHRNTLHPDITQTGSTPTNLSTPYNMWEI